MKCFIYQKQWGWLASGLALGAVFVLAVVLVKPVGVSTQFVILDGIVWDLFSDDVVMESVDSKTGYSSANAYLNKSGGKYAKNIANPVNYSFVFVVAMVAGGYVANKLQVESNNEAADEMPAVWRERFGGSASKRYIAAFLGGY